MPKNLNQIILGETIGTFLLVFIGCSSVAAAVLMGWLNLYGVAMVFGAGVSLGIYASRRWSDAHLNPAVTLSLFISKNLTANQIIPNIIGQVLGALLGGLAILGVWNNEILNFERSLGSKVINGLSQKTAMIFGEFFPNPTFPSIECSPILACLTEAVGTFVLMTVIYLVSRLSSRFKNLIPLLIGLTVTVLIIFLAPYTQGGFNPARDLMPRMVAFFTHWGENAFPAKSFSWFYVYVLSPIAGASLAGILGKKKPDLTS